MKEFVPLPLPSNHIDMKQAKTVQPKEEKKDTQTDEDHLKSKIKDAASSAIDVVIDTMNDEEAKQELRLKASEYVMQANFGKGAEDLMKTNKNIDAVQEIANLIKRERNPESGTQTDTTYPANP